MLHHPEGGGGNAAPATKRKGSLSRFGWCSCLTFFFGLVLPPPPFLLGGAAFLPHSLVMLPSLLLLMIGRGEGRRREKGGVQFTLLPSPPSGGATFLPSTLCPCGWCCSLLGGAALSLSPTLPLGGGAVSFPERKLIKPLSGLMHK